MLVFILSALAFLAHSAPPSDASLDALQSAWDETKSYRADFTQSVHSKAAALEEDAARGTITVVKPDKLRWEDTTNNTTQLLNGEDYWEITSNPRRKSRTVTHTPKVSAMVGKTALAILTGRGKFKEFYRVKLLEDSPAEARLQLKPKAGGAETLIAKIDKKGYVLRSLTTDSPDSKVVVEFTNIQRNSTFPEKLFCYVKLDGDVFQTRKE